MRGPLLWNQEKYDHRKLEEAIKDVVKRRHWKVDQITDSMYPSNPDRCRT
jgi:predicted transcriptional regulator